MNPAGTGQINGFPEKDKKASRDRKDRAKSNVIASRSEKVIDIFPSLIKLSVDEGVWDLNPNV